MYLIDREKLIEALEDMTWFHINRKAELVEGASSKTTTPLYKAEEVYELIENFPTARESGRWMVEILDGAIGYRPRLIYCSECRTVVMAKTNFCPHCGADMREKEWT